VAGDHTRAKEVIKMRNPLLLLAIISGLAGLSIPASAESDGGACGAQASVAPSGPIDLETIPMKDANGPKAINRVGDDDACGDVSTSGKSASDESRLNPGAVERSSDEDED
jgi:hypothetical protein